MWNFTGVFPLLLSPTNFLQAKQTEWWRRAINQKCNWCVMSVLGTCFFFPAHQLFFKALWSFYLHVCVWSFHCSPPPFFSCIIQKWQRRFFILYEHGLLRYALDEMVSKVLFLSLYFVNVKMVKPYFVVCFLFFITKTPIYCCLSLGRQSLAKDNLYLLPDATISVTCTVLETIAAHGKPCLLIM